MTGLLFDKSIEVLPFQLLAMDEAVVVKRGMTEIKLSGENVFEIVKVIQVALQKEQLTVRDTIELFSAPNHEFVAKVLSLLFEKKFIVYSSEGNKNPGLQETAEDLFFWHFKTKSDPAKSNQKTTIVVCGINRLMITIANHFSLKGEFELIGIDDPLLCDPNFYDGGKIPESVRKNFTKVFGVEDWKDHITKVRLADTNYFLLAGTDAGNFNYLRDWNEFCFKNKIVFLPVLLSQMRGYIGPVILPGSTPCLECTINRVNSHATNFVDNENLRDKYLHDGRIQYEAYHGSMLNVICQTAIFEAERYLYGIPGVKFGELLEINLLASSFESHKILKVPRCKVCTPLNKRPAVMLLKRLASIETWTELEKTGSV